MGVNHAVGHLARELDLDLDLTFFLLYFVCYASYFWETQKSRFLSQTRKDIERFARPYSLANSVP